MCDDADAGGEEEQLQVPQQRVRGPQDVRGLRRTAYLQDDEEQHHPEHGTGHREVEAAGDHLTDQLAAEQPHHPIQHGGNSKSEWLTEAAPGTSATAETT